MSNLTRWSPYREMASFRRLMNRFIEDPFLEPYEMEETFNWEIPLDVMENQDEYLVKASLPGIDPDHLEITYNNNTLTIHTEVKSEQEKKGDKEHRYHLRERRYGSFSRSIFLPVAIDSNKIKADYDSGVLSLMLPKTEEVKPKRIPINVMSSRQPVIEGKSRTTQTQKQR